LSVVNSPCNFIEQYRSLCFWIYRLGIEYPTESRNERHPKFSSLEAPYEEWVTRFQVDPDVDIMHWFIDTRAALSYIETLITPSLVD